ncbi:MAG: PAS domain S-box protein, partial [Rhodoferax sp.]|nr:PAS domain S-box protein [Rhodoferax sp.]
RKDGSLGWYGLHTAALTSGGKEFIGMLTDITERQQAQMAQRESLQRLQAIASRVPGMVYMYRRRPDGSSTFPYVSEAISEIYRISAQEVGTDARRLFALIHPEDRHGVLDSIDRSARELSLWSYEYRVKFADGVERWLLGNAMPQGDEDGSVTWHGFVTDITERKRMEEELAAHRAEVLLGVSRQRLRELVVQNEKLREDDRKNLAREVHDELGQVMAGIRMSLLLMEMRYCSLDPGLSQLVGSMKSLLDRGIKGVRDVVTHLRPVALDLGLVSAIESLCTEFSVLNVLEFVFNPPNEDVILDERRLVVVFRIVQESITNILRHARATRVDIDLKLSSYLEVQIQDDGTGFDVSAARQKMSFGLLGMQERAIALGGSVEIDSAPGQGTRVRLVVPLQADSLKVAT